MAHSPIYTTAAMRRLEALAAGGALTLMERAGAAAAEAARRMCGEKSRSILVVAGPGNNGGDAFEAAARLKGEFFRVTVVFAGERGKLPKDAQAALGKWESAGGTLLADIPREAHFDLVIDGLFGIGLTRPLAGAYAALVGRMNALGAPILSLDIPSGINADTGAVMGCAVRATRTVTFIAHKPGPLMLDGPDHCGELSLDSLGKTQPELLIEPEGRLLDAAILDGVPAPRPKNFHKGRAGSVGVLGGGAGMVGAAVIAARAALKCGAGRVYVGLLTPRPPYLDYVQPELMLRKPAELLASDLVDVLIAGPGMGVAAPGPKLLGSALKTEAALVLDADALNLIAANRRLGAVLAKRTRPSVLTPHPGEAARLLGRTTEQVQADRLAAARAIAHNFRSFTVLKGNGSIIAEPGGKFWINPSGNSGMASAGMGDALSGMVAALCAQGAAPLQALLAGTYLHGAAADALVAAGAGPVGITASEVIEAARRLINRPRRSST